MQSNDQAVPVRRTALWVGRVISGLCVLFLALDGVVKLFKPAPVLEACARLGIPESTIIGLGVLLLACTAAYAFSATAILGAVLLTGYLGGAIATHVRVGDPAFTVAFASTLGVLVWVGLFLRGPRLRALVPFRRAGT
jgi:hypothetical protein